MSMLLVHPTAVVDSDAQIAPDVEIGPYAVIEGPVRIGRGTKVWPHAYLSAPLEIGEDCQVHIGAILGHLHQALREPQEGGVRIGARTIIREYVSVHRSSRKGTWTSIGSDCLLMGLSHVAHDCTIGDKVIIANGTLVAGHVTIEDKALLSGHVVVHQFVRIGTLAMVAGLARAIQDVPPYFLVKGDTKVWSLNVVGMRRAKFSSETTSQIRKAYRLLYRSGLNTTQALEAMQKMPERTPELNHLIQFIQNSERGICRHYSRNPKETFLDSDEEDVV